MKKWAILFLKFSTILCAVPVFFFCIRILPGILSGALDKYPELEWTRYSMYFGFYLTAALCLFVLYQTFRLLQKVESNKVSGEQTRNILKSIQWSSFSISVVYLLMSPVVYYIADHEDAPGILLIELIVLFAWLVVAAISIVLKSLLPIKPHNEAKSEI